MKTEHVKKAVQDKPVLSAISGITALLSAKSVFDLLKFGRTGELRRFFPRTVSVSMWHSYYRSHNLLQNNIVNHTSNDGSTDFQVSQLLRELRSISQEDIKEGLSFLADKDNASILKSLNTDLLNETIDEFVFDKPVEELPESFFRLPEFAFFLRIWIPCWFYYGEYPTTLFRQARNGNVSSICKLVKLDKTIIYEPRIKACICNLEEFGSRISFNKIMTALTQKPKKLSLEKIRCRVSALTQLYNARLGKYTAPDIIKLYDAAIKDKTGDPTLIDLSLQSPETFQKALQRERKEIKAPRILLDD